MRQGRRSSTSLLADISVASSVAVIWCMNYKCLFSRWNKYTGQRTLGMTHEASWSYGRGFQIGGGGGDGVCGYTRINKSIMEE